MSRRASIWRTDEWVRPYLRTYGKALALAIFLGVAASAAACALMFTSGYMISLAAALPLTVLALHVPSLFVRIFGIGKPLLRYGEKLCSHDWVLRMTSEMRRKLYLVLDQRLSQPESREGTAIGSVLALLNDDIGHVQNLIMRSILPLASTWVLAVVVVAASGALSWQLAGIMGAMLVLLAVVAPLCSAAVNAARVAAAKAAQGRLYEGLADDVFGITDWVLSGRREEYLHRLDAELDAREHARCAVSRFERGIGLASQAVFCLCVVAVLAWASAAFCDAQGLEGALGAIAAAGSENAPAYPPNWIAAFILCLFPLMEALAPLPAAAMSLTEQRGALERLNRTSATSATNANSNPAETDRIVKNARCVTRSSEKERIFGSSTSGFEETRHTSPDSCTISSHIEPFLLGTGQTPAAAGEAEAGALSAPDVLFDEVSFAYPGGTEIVSDMTLAIPFGQKIAITGRSGAGKTTLTKLVLGIVEPTRGSVSVGGVAPSDHADGMWRTVGVLHQRPKLFAMTLRENLAIGNERAADEEMLRVLDAVGLRKRFDRLPQGLSSLVQEGAFNLSGGEAHRIALARILLADQPIVILDEPFAALDPRTEREALATTLHALAGRTVIAITHNPESTAAFDRIIDLGDASETP